MRLAFAPVPLLLVVVILDFFLSAFGLPTLVAGRSLRVSNGVCGGLLLWITVFGVRGYLRDQEETAARRQAEAALLRERNPELWMARQLHDTAVTERTTAILTAIRQRPLHVRLRSLTSSRDGNLGV